MFSTLDLCKGLLAFSTLASASYRALPRNYQIRDTRLNGTSTSTPSMTSPSSSSPIGINSTPTSPSSDSSLLPIDITTSPQPECLGSVTYYSTIPPTVYETVTIPFTVTVTAANVSLTTPAIYTPPPPCLETVFSAASSSTKCQGNCPLNNPSTGALQTFSGSLYTSTVLVTKKTPVPTVIPDTSAPPDYHIPSTSTPRSNPNPSPQPAPSPSPTPIPGSQPPSPIPAVQSNIPGPAGNSGAAASSKSPGGSGSSPKATADATRNKPEPAGGRGGQTTAPNIGSLVNSGINGPIPPTVAANPSTTNVNGVPVIVLPSSSGVVIGGQLVSIPPSGSSTVVVANGNTFTLGKSAILGPGTTIAFAADQNPANPTPVTANGLTFKVGATQAIISGKTYAIGAGAPTTSLTIGGQTIVVGPSGVGVPGKTIVPVKAATTGPSSSVVTAGGLTITYDLTEAIVGSTTYRIGPGASQTLITVNGKTVSLGAGGVGLASSTIPPAKFTKAGPSLSAVTVDGVSFSVDATEVVIGSSTFRIGSGAPTKTTVVNGHTISIGPSGIGLDSTTIRPPTATAGLQTGDATSARSPLLFGLAALLGCIIF